MGVVQEPPQYPYVERVNKHWTWYDQDPDVNDGMSAAEWWLTCHRHRGGPVPEGEWDRTSGIEGAIREMMRTPIDAMADLVYMQLALDARPHTYVDVDPDDCCSVFVIWKDHLVYSYSGCKPWAFYWDGLEELNDFLQGVRDAIVRGVFRVQAYEKLTCPACAEKEAN